MVVIDRQHKERCRTGHKVGSLILESERFYNLKQSMQIRSLWAKAGLLTYVK